MRTAPAPFRTPWAQAPASAARRDAPAARRLGAGDDPANARSGVAGDGTQLYWNSNSLRLACPEGNDASNRVVRRDADGDAVPGNNLNAEAAHAAAELSEHFVSGVTLH